MIDDKTTDEGRAWYQDSDTGTTHLWNRGSDNTVCGVPADNGSPISPYLDLCEDCAGPAREVRERLCIAFRDTGWPGHLLHPNGALEGTTARSLADLQQGVGGYIALVYCDDLILVADDEGLLKRYPVNRKASEIAGVPLVGNVLVFDRFLFDCYDGALFEVYDEDDS